MLSFAQITNKACMKKTIFILIFILIGQIHAIEYKCPCCEKLERVKNWLFSEIYRYSEYLEFTQNSIEYFSFLGHLEEAREIYKYIENLEKKESY